MSKVSAIQQAISKLQGEIDDREKAIAVLRSVETKAPKRKPRPSLLTAVNEGGLR